MCRLNELSGRSARRETVDEEIFAATETMQVDGNELSERRSRASARLAEMVRAGLKDLGFVRSDFAIFLERLDLPSAQGNELVEFLFSANPGEPPRPLRSIGSSGEISRVMLALKSALADQDDVPILVFDEIDANVGGEIAARVGCENADTWQITPGTLYHPSAASGRRRLTAVRGDQASRGRADTNAAARDQRQVAGGRNRQNARREIKIRSRTRTCPAERCRLTPANGC